MFPRSPVLSRVSGPDFQNACWVPLLQTGSRIHPSLLLPFNQRQVLRLLLSKYLLNQSPLNGLSSHSLSSGLTFLRGIIASRPPTCSPCRCLPHLLSVPHITAIAIFLRSTPAVARRENVQRSSIVFRVVYKKFHSLDLLSQICLLARPFPSIT